MALAIFDLDNTLLTGDSDYLWGRYLVENKIVDPDFYDRENRRFYQEYGAGTLDINEFLRFSLKVLAAHDKKILFDWRKDFIEQKIIPIIPAAAHHLLNKHREQGDILLIITATNRFVTELIAKELDIEHLLATDPEEKEGQYTGNFTGIPTYQEGKVVCLKEWLKVQQITLEGSWFYSDSHNDLPLLKIVDNPIAVDPDETLKQYANHHGWPTISLRS
ncbi:MAG: HAD-IB family hydrolase [Gammaproteobacteria bacterium]|nr:HAD-IB family hydrolase [Gammaproteobacteria bacterium]